MMLMRCRIPMMLSLALLTFGVLSCRSLDPSASRTRNIFKEDVGDADKGNDRRRPATDEELLKVVKIEGCTGFLLSPRLMMTAHHCILDAVTKPLSSGAALVRQEKGDIKYEKTVEQDEGLDYAIFLISWPKGLPKEQKYMTRLATKPDGLNAGAGANEGDEVYTVGFPVDKKEWRATFAKGRVKSIEDTWFKYDIGTINGNSGGPVLRQKDDMLMSLTNRGLHAFDEEGWDQNDTTNVVAWNFGPLIWQIYASSLTLPEVFPDGRYDAAKEQDFLEHRLPVIENFVAYLDPANLNIEKNGPGRGFALTAPVEEGNTGDKAQGEANSPTQVSMHVQGMFVKLSVQGSSFKKVTMSSFMVLDKASMTPSDPNAKAYTASRLSNGDARYFNGRPVLYGGIVESGIQSNVDKNYRTSMYKLTPTGKTNSCGHVFYQGETDSDDGKIRVEIEDAKASRCPAKDYNFIAKETWANGKTQTVYGKR